MSRKYSNMVVFQKADILAKDVYKKTREFPKEELYGIVSQLRRSALSIPVNIVEGCAKSSDRDFVRFLEIALGSAFEVCYLVEFSKDLDYLNQSSAAELNSSITTITKMLQVLLKRIRSELKNTTKNS